VFGGPVDGASGEGRFAGTGSAGKEGKAEMFAVGTEGGAFGQVVEEFGAAVEGLLFGDERGRDIDGASLGAFDDLLDAVEAGAFAGVSVEHAEDEVDPFGGAARLEEGEVLEVAVGRVEFIGGGVGEFVEWEFAVGAEAGGMEAGDEFEEEAAEGVDVIGGFEVAVFGNFRWSIAGVERGGGVVEGLELGDESVVDESALAVCVDEDVGGAEVAVDVAEAVEVVEAGEDLGEDGLQAIQQEVESGAGVDFVGELVLEVVGIEVDGVEGAGGGAFRGNGGCRFGVGGSVSGGVGRGGSFGGCRCIGWLVR